MIFLPQLSKLVDGMSPSISVYDDTRSTQDRRT